MRMLETIISELERATHLFLEPTRPTQRRSAAPSSSFLLVVLTELDLARLYSLGSTKLLDHLFCIDVLDICVDNNRSSLACK